MPAKLPEISTIAAGRLRQLGAAVRLQRKRLGVSATLAAESAGMSRTTWHRIEQGNPAVTTGAFMQALSVLGMTVEMQQEAQQLENGKAQAHDHRKGWMPTRIMLSDYPQLQQLAWHVRGPETFALSPREALDIYERHGRHISSMSDEEQELLTALQDVLGSTNGV